ncbi:uncharacterized protein F5147DRAFT_778404 [Suillus discolor]|uniref:C2H2-type domain-containing protein n=1 Tax=Suillus discolor TaxID=1912936 RepID=A0A9P7EYP8_9AGAM|nr:uncharacterized protein F5147DRAFT_778404 [Suillus discolor]KAG2096355.1 hypothetical protein F5147DRAFT_778404 [Suillus discolor]
MTPSQLVQAPDQYLMKPTLQSYLKYLDRHIDRMFNTYREMLEIRSRIAELLASDQSEVTEGTWDGTVGIQAIVDEPQTITPSVLHEINATSSEITGSSSESVNDPLGQLPQDILPSSSSGSDSYESRAQDFVPQHGTYSEGQTLSSSSARRDEQLLPKVRCTQPGCSSVVNKSNLTRHINEVHERKVKARCASCGKGFTRPYMMEDHIRRANCASP